MSGQQEVRVMAFPDAIAAIFAGLALALFLFTKIREEAARRAAEAVSA